MQSPGFIVLLTCCVLAMLVSRGSCECPPHMTHNSCTCDAAHKVACTNLTEANLPTAAEMKDITYIVFRECNIPNLVDIPYTDAETLIIHGSGVKTINDNAFSKMTYLENLELGSNELDTLRPETFTGLGELRKLLLSDNKLSTIEAETFSAETLPKLEWLHLNDNQNLGLSGDVFGTGSTVSHLYIENCGLTSVPVAALNKTTELITLSVSRNHLSAIEDNSLRSLGRLTVLHLASCDLTMVAEATFAGLSSLKVLNLGSNRIESIHDDAFKDCKETLTTFHCQSNRLTGLSTWLLNWDELEKATLAYNPWYCGNCSSVFMKDITHELDNCTCAGPEELKGQVVTEVDANTLCQDYPSDSEGGDNTMVYVVVIIIVSLCLGGVAFFLFKIIQNRRQNRDPKKVRYSAVYKDTTEATPRGSSPPATSNRPTSDL